jgi:acyl transferase domain-containing protein
LTTFDPGPEDAPEVETGRDVAVVGMAGRFPKARDLGEFWRNLRDGVEAVTFFSDAELAGAGVDPALLADPGYVKAGSVLAGVEEFDAGFFGYTASEAEVMDPQQRLFLEHCWAALEDAGYDPATYPGLIGVYAGVAWNTYLLTRLARRPDLFAGGGGFQVFITNDKDFMPTRVSYKLNLKGPSVVVQTSCSTSLVAVHLACLSLLNYECDMALVGGVTVKVPQTEGYLHLEGGLASPDGHCRAFDAKAAGTVFGSGVGVVVLKRFGDALADGDRVRAVVKGSAINNDGAVKVSYTAPSVEGQAEVIAAAHAVAGIDVETIGYVEAHGTGTALGDPIEVAALTKVFGAATARTGFCALGSVKSNVGHLDAAAGIAGFLKTVLALEHRQIPPSLHFETPNPKIDFAATPFHVNARLADWPAAGGPRRAGVSSFGVGGTNAHVVLEEAPAPPPAAPSRPGQLLLLSARSAAALDAASANLAAHLASHPELPLPDVAYTLRAGRAVFRHRRMLVCHDASGAAAATSLAALDPARVATGVDTQEPRERPVVFVFPGQGANLDIGSEAGDLYRLEAVFREEIDRCAELLVPHLGLDLREVIQPAPGTDREAAVGSDLAGPSLFAVEYALARLWTSWGIRPRALLGEGLGEVVAACLAGAFSLADALALVAAAGKSPAAEAFAARVRAAPRRPPEIPLLATAGGFADALAGLRQDPGRMLLEVGPGQTQELLLAALGRLWLAGVAIDWSGFHAGERRRRVPLPTYPFERQRYWVDVGTDIGERPAAASAEPLARRPAIADWFYVPGWKLGAPPRPLAPGDLAADPRRRWLVFADGCGLGDGLAARLAREGREVVTVRPAARFAALGRGAYEIDPGRGEDYDLLLADLAGQDQLPDAVIHAWSVAPQERREPTVAAFEAAQVRGFHSLLGLARALAPHLAALAADARLELWVLSSQLHRVTGEEALAPERATVLGPCRVIPQEQPGIVCQAVDVALPPYGRAPAALVDRVLAEIAGGPVGPFVAWRGGRRWVQSFEPVRLEPAPERSPLRPLREQGVYLITGGLEGNGHGVARVLAATASARLVLQEEDGFPERERWAEAAAAGGPLARKVARALALEAAGAELLVIGADLGDEAAMALLVERGRERFGHLHGAVHAAGVTGERIFRPLADTGREESAWHFVPRAHGLLALDRALAGLRLDFRLALSSLAAVLGGLGYAAYAAANLFVDAFVQGAAGRGDGGWLGLDWDAWQLGVGGEDGAGGEGDDGEAEAAALSAGLAGLAMRFDEGGEVLRRALAAATAELVAVSTADLVARVEQGVLRSAARRGEGGDTAAAARALHPRPRLETPYVAPEGDLEATLAGVWRRVLGFAEVGVHDNFFELGGDSFIAIRMAAELRGALRLEIPVARLYQALTIRALARLLESERGEEERRAAQLAERKEQMSRRKEFQQGRRADRRSRGPA